MTVFEHEAVFYQALPEGPYRQVLLAGCSVKNAGKFGLATFPLLIELRGCLLFWMSVKARCAPSPAIIFDIAKSIETLLHTVSMPKALRRLIDKPLTPSASQIESHVSEEVGVSMSLLNQDFSDATNWNLGSFATYRLLNSLATRSDFDATAYSRDMERALRSGLALFVDQLDESAISLLREIGQLRPEKYNYFVGPNETVGKYRNQAAAVIPLAVMHVLTSNDDCSEILRLGIDRGHPLVENLVRHHKVSPSAVRQLVGVQPAWLEKAPQVGFSMLIRVLNDIEPDFRPKTEEQWKRFASALATIGRLTSGLHSSPLYRFLVRHLARKQFSLPSVLLDNLQNHANIIEAFLSSLAEVLSFEFQCAHEGRRPENIQTTVVHHFVNHLSLDRLIDVSRRYQDALRRENRVFGEERRLLLSPRWPSPLTAPLPIGNFVVVPLLSPEELVQESRVMNNCINTYSDSCASGSCQLFSVRDIKQKSVSCIETNLRRELRGEFSLRVEQHTGPDNSIPEAGLGTVVDGLIRHVCNGGDGVEQYWNWKTRIAILSIDQRKAKADLAPAMKALDSVLPRRHSLEHLIDTILA